MGLYAPVLIQKKIANCLNLHKVCKSLHCTSIIGSNPYQQHRELGRGSFPLRGRSLEELKIYAYLQARKKYIFALRCCKLAHLGFHNISYPQIPDFSIRGSLALENSTRGMPRHACIGKGLPHRKRVSHYGKGCRIRQAVSLKPAPFFLHS